MLNWNFGCIESRSWGDFAKYDFDLWPVAKAQTWKEDFLSTTAAEHPMAVGAAVLPSFFGILSVFPLTPSWPAMRRLRDRKVRLQMDSGKQYVRSEGTDQWVLELIGVGTSGDVTTLLDFYETQAEDIFTFQDTSFSPTVDRVVVFGEPPAWEEQTLKYFTWRCILLETTMV